MTTDDPFFDGADQDRTVLKPTPGKRRGASAPAESGGGGGATPPPRPAQPRAAAAAPVAQFVTPGLNPLVDAAGALLSLATQLRNSPSHNDPGGLNQHVAREIQNFENSARQRGVKPESVLAARYCLCTFLDEVVLSTPWGANSPWRERTLLTSFHREAWGGEKFYTILERVTQDPAGNIDLIELLHLCLMLGFEGKYRVQERGSEQLVAIQDRLQTLIRQQRGEAEPDLSPRWQGVEDLRSPLARYVPLWAVAAGAAGFLALVYAGFLFSLSGVSAPVVGELQVMGRDPVVIEQRRESRARTLDLAGFLAPEVAQGLVDVSDRPGRSTIVVRGNGLFATGSASVSADRRALMSRIAEALNTEIGRVNISGHTDNIPIRGALRLRFPTNQELSQARADAVLSMLEGDGVLGTRMTAEGRGESEPIADNSTPAGRSQNRRVEIVLNARGGIR